MNDYSIFGDFFDHEVWEYVFDLLEGNRGAKDNLIKYIKSYDQDTLPPYALTLLSVVEGKKRPNSTPVMTRTVESAQMRMLCTVLKAGKGRIRFDSDIT